MAESKCNFNPIFKQKLKPNLLLLNHLPVLGRVATAAAGALLGRRGAGLGLGLGGLGLLLRFGLGAVLTGGGGV